MGAVDAGGLSLLLSGGGSSQHVYCVVIAFKMTEENNESASNFALTLNIPPWKRFDYSEDFRG